MHTGSVVVGLGIGLLVGLALPGFAPGLFTQEGGPPELVGRESLRK